LTTDATQENARLVREAAELEDLTAQPDKSISFPTMDDSGGGGIQSDEGVLSTENIVKVPSYNHKRRFLSDELTGLYCPLCAERCVVLDINRTMGGRVYRINCHTHGMLDVELWE
jgi:hypothetical protein